MVKQIQNQYHLKIRRKEFRKTPYQARLHPARIQINLENRVDESIIIKPPKL